MTKLAGKLVTDKLTGDSVFVVKRMETTIDEQVATYDYNKNPIYVYEMEKDKEYDCSPDDEAIMVVYPDILEDRFGSNSMSAEEVAELVDKNKIKPYYFPASRLE